MAGPSESLQPVGDDANSDESNEDCLQLEDTSHVAKSHPGAASSSTAGSIGTHSECLNAFSSFSLEEETPQKLRDEKMTIDDISPIEVVQHEGKYVTLGNSKLRVLKEFGRSISANIVDQSSEEFLRKLTRRQDDGATIRMATNNKNQANVLLKRNENEYESSFLSSVLRGSVRDVSDVNKYRSKVRQIPERFLNVDSYYEAFKWPLLEDTRAQLHGSLEDIRSAHYLRIRYIDEFVEDNSSTDARPRDRQPKKFKITIFSGGQKRGKGDAWKPKPMDLLMLCNFVPTSLTKLRNSEGNCIFALIAFSQDDFRSSFVVIAYVPKWSSKYSKMLKYQGTWNAIYLNNMATGMRIWDALNPGPEVLQDPLKLKIVKKTLCTAGSTDLEERPSIYPGFGGHRAEDVDSLASFVNEYCNVRGLNFTQREVISTIVRGLLTGDASHMVKLVQGPPGTGKTQSMSVLLSIISCLNYRVLVCAPTNRAVSELAERFLKTLEEGPSALSQFCGHASQSINGRLKYEPLDHMGDIVMVSSEDKVDSNGILGNIILSERTSRLVAALAPHSGWRHSAELVINFLSGGSSLAKYEEYQQDWKEKGEPRPPHVTFLEFLREQLDLLGTSMLRSGHVMCSDLPTNILNAKERRLISKTCLVLEKLLRSLAEREVTDTQARSWLAIAHASERQDTNVLTVRTSRLKISGNGFRKEKEKLLTHEVQAWLCCQLQVVRGRKCIKDTLPFQYAIIVEAAQLVEAETAIITRMTGLHQVLLVGDPNQLTAMVTSKVAKACGYGRSLFERLQVLGHPYQIFSIQYRMHPEISQFPNRQFYGDVVKDGPNVQSKLYKKPWQVLYGPYAFIDVQDGEEERGKGGSFKNSLEAAVVQYIVNHIREGHYQNVSVGVISPYRGQVENMREQINTPSLTTGADKCQVDFRTVDGFQGGERDIILFSAVRANAKGNIGFLNDFRRLNVALTRGRHCVWIIGNASTLAAENDTLHDHEIWRALINDAKNRLCYRDARDIEGLRDIILQCKRMDKSRNSIRSTPAVQKISI